MLIISNDYIEISSIIILIISFIFIKIFNKKLKDKNNKNNYNNKINYILIDNYKEFKQ